jgi:hypothetical protein
MFKLCKEQLINRDMFFDWVNEEKLAAEEKGYAAGYKACKEERTIYFKRTTK